MHRYVRSIGFSMHRKKTEIKALMDKIQKENIALSKIVVNNDKERLWEIRKDLSENLGICLYGYLENLGNFVREGFYPYIRTAVKSSTSTCTIQKHLDDELCSGMIDDNRLGISLIFRLSNSFEYLNNFNNIKIEYTSLFGFCDDGRILLPVKKTMSQIALSKMQLLNRNLLIEAAKEGDKEAIDTLSTDELRAYSSISSRIQNEDVYSIVDTLFMPYGMEADMYTIVGAITDIKEETNSMTGESLLILQVESNDIPLSIALKKEDLQGEPMIGRRFKGNVWMLGNIKPEAAAK